MLLVDDHEAELAELDAFLEQRVRADRDFRGARCEVGERARAGRGVIVSERAGTTRDAIDTELDFSGRTLVLVDTAGLRRRGKVAGTVGYYAQLRSERAVERADVALVVCDASEGVTSEDLRAAELAMKSGCATLIALNKWDIGRTDLEDATARLSKRLRQRPPVVTCSATRGKAWARSAGSIAKSCRGPT